MPSLRLLFFLVFGSVVNGKPGFLHQYINPVHPVGLQHLVIGTHSNALNPYVVQPFHFLPKDLFIASPPLLRVPEAVTETPEKQQEKKQDDDVVVVEARQEAQESKGGKKGTIKEVTVKSEDDPSPLPVETKVKSPNKEDEKKESSVQVKTVQQQQPVISFLQPTLSFMTVQPLLRFHRVQPLAVNPILPPGSHHIQPPFLYNNLYQPRFY